MTTLDIPITSSALFDLDTTTTPSTSVLTVVTTDFNDVGLYMLFIRAYFSGYSSNSFYHKFEVELIDPCPTAILTINDAILRPVGTTPPTMTESIG